MSICANRFRCARRCPTPLRFQLRAVDGHVAASFQMVGRAHEDGDDVCRDGIDVDVGRQKGRCDPPRRYVLAVDQHGAARNHLHLQRIYGGEHGQIVLRGAEHFHRRLRRGDGQVDGGQLRGARRFRRSAPAKGSLRRFPPASDPARRTSRCRPPPRGRRCRPPRWSAAFGDEDLVAVLRKEIDGVRHAAVVQRDLADHGRALAARVRRSIW